MVQPALQTLFLPFENGDIAPGGQSNILFLGAAFHPFLKQFLKLTAWQPFRPAAQILEDSGIPLASTLPPQKDYTHALVLLPKQADEARFFLSHAMRALKDGGTLIAAAANDAGGNRLEKWFAELGLSPSSLSKNKCRVVYAVKHCLPDTAIEWIAQGEARTLPFGDNLDLVTRPGLFSWDRPDPGSMLLAQSLPAALSGRGADFGCGIGYLSARALRQCAGIKSLYLADADSRALDCAKQNLPSEKCAFHWRDLTVPPKEKFDFILMNPPFHIGRETDSGLGLAFLESAAACLERGGRLYMVANRHLPYERTLAGHFSSTALLNAGNGFKITESTK